MGKTFKKIDILENINEEDELNELIDLDGTLIDRYDNFKSTDKDVKSKFTSREKARRSSQGPASYYPWGGAYYGGYYSMNEDEDILDLDDDNFNDELSMRPIKKYDRGERERRKAKEYADKDITSHFYKPSDPIYDELPVEKWRKYKLPYDTRFDIDITENDLTEEIDEIANSKMKSLVDEMLTKRKNYDIVKKRTDEADVLHDVNIPDFSELKSKYEKPIVARKVIHLTDLIKKQNINGEEMAIILNYLLDNLDISKINNEHRELLGDKLKYGEEGE